MIRTPILTTPIFHVLNIESSVTGTVTPTVLHSINLPSKILTQCSIIKIMSHFLFTVSSDIKTYSITFGGNSIFNYSDSSNSSQQHFRMTKVICRQSINSKLSVETANVDGLGNFNNITTYSVDNNNIIPITFIGELSNISDSITLKCAHIEIYDCKGF